MIKRTVFNIQGRVQGVGFRWFVEQTAKSMKLNGEVRNLYDGSVEAVIEADDNQTAEFKDKLRTGPTSAYVERVTYTQYNELKYFNDFRIK